MNSQIEHLRAKEIIFLHDRAIKDFGGLPGLACPGRIDAIIARVVNYAEYEGINDLYLLAAMYCIAIAKGHAFADGNKRTALNATTLFFLRNGVALRKTAEVDEILVDVACDKIGLTELADYLRMMPQISGV